MPSRPTTTTTSSSSNNARSRDFESSIYLEEPDDDNNGVESVMRMEDDILLQYEQEDGFYLEQQEEYGYPLHYQDQSNTSIISLHKEHSGNTGHSSSEEDDAIMERSAKQARGTRSSRTSTTRTNSSSLTSTAAVAAAAAAPRQYSIHELVETLGQEEGHLSHLQPELQRRVLDFRLAQQKRRQVHGTQQRWGIFGMYSYLQSVRIDLEWAEDAAWRRRHGAPYLSWADFDQERRKSTRIRPYFTYVLIALCSLMMIVVFAMNDWKVEPMQVNPLIGPSAETLVRAGARDTEKIIDEGQWFRIFTPLALHAGLIHYGVNMAALWFIGGAVEQSHGIINTVLLFMIPGVGGNILSALFLPQFISVGASGGIFGLIGGCTADITLNWRLLFINYSPSENGNRSAAASRQNIYAILWLVLDIVVNAVIGLTPMVDNFSHLGGLIYGLCCGWSTIEPLSVGFFGVNTTSWQKAKVLVVRFFGIIVSVVAIMLTTLWLASADVVGQTPCSNCRYISCVPFPFFQQDKWWYCDDCDMVTADLYTTGNVYSRIDLTCPDQTIESINISSSGTTNRDDVQRRLPGLCREYCNDRFN